MNVQTNSNNFENMGKWPWTEASGYTVQQRFFLTRLERLSTIAKSLPEQPDTSRVNDVTLQRKLLDRALYSTFRDCVSLGVLDEARMILGGEGKKNKIATK